MNAIRRVAVLGAGTMGSRIAAHLANAGIPSLLLDLVLPEEADRNAAARKGIEAAARQRPAAFFTDSARQLVQPGNFEDDLPQIRDCDWVIEAVVEDLQIKRDIWRRAEEFLRPEAIRSTNTSGIPLAKIAEGFSPEFQRCFLGTHFFNPPRYLHLVELVPAPATDAGVLDAVGAFCDRRLGKGVVRCKDTPNFIANRIGAFFGATVHKIMVEEGYSIEEVDALTGPLIGLPRSASFRLLDIIGLDVWAMVLRNLHEAVPEDGWRERFLVPAFMEEMLRRGWLGEKSGQGFYRRVGKGAGRVIEAVDWKTFAYHPAAKPEFPALEEARRIEDVGARLRRLVSAGDRAGSLVWKLWRDVLLYAAERVPEISDRIVEIDRAMRWGYAFQLGPFEVWDALGFQETAHRMEEEGKALPENIQRMLAAGTEAFYRPADREGEPRTEYFDLVGQRYKELEPRPGVLSLADIKRARGVVAGNTAASLVDLGDGVLCVEFHTKRNALAEDAFRIVHQGLEETERNFEAMVIANQGEQFSAGADLTWLLLAARNGDWDDIGDFVRAFQELNAAIRRAVKPVVAAPFGRTLDGACEMALHAARRQASAELYMGLTAFQAGLLPAAGGVTQLLANLGNPDTVYKLISSAATSASAPDARRLGLLSPADEVTMNPERLVGDAKSLALGLAPNYVPNLSGRNIEVGGEALYARLMLDAWLAREAGRISEYDTVIAEKLAFILSGGRLTGAQKVGEQYLRELEREAFLSLCGNEKTQERIEHLLRTGKPLRN